MEQVDSETQGGGDCDRDDQCQAGLVCGSDNCLRWREAGGFWQAEDDCCEQRYLI